MKQRWNGWVLAAGALAVSATAQAAPPTAEMISFACAGCHGTNGGSAGLSMPSLAAQSKTAIVDAMKKFKSGERPSTVMGRLAMASQWLNYLQMQMDLYQSGKRKMPEKMAEKVKPLSKEDLDALLHFYASVNK